MYTAVLRLSVDFSWRQKSERHFQMRRGRLREVLGEDGENSFDRVTGKVLRGDGGQTGSRRTTNCPAVCKLRLENECLWHKGLDSRAASSFLLAGSSAEPASLSASVSGHPKVWAMFSASTKARAVLGCPSKAKQH